MIPDLWREAREIAGRLDDEVRACAQAGAQLAQNERDYRVALAGEQLRLRSQGLPATLIGDVARGDPRIADLKCARDCSEAVYDAARESINVHKKQLTVINDQMAREWNSGGN